MPLCGQPVLGHVLDRVSRTEGIEAVIVATSTGPDDEAVAAWCTARSVYCHRGPLEDVAGRFLQALEHVEWDAFVRVNGDSPVLDSSLISQGVTLFKSTTPDVATNVLTRTFPKGQSVEVVSRAAFSELCRRTSDPQDREHVTRYFYRHPEMFRIEEFRSGIDLSAISMVIDTPEDFARMENILAGLPQPHANHDLQAILHRLHRVETVR